MQSQMEEEKKQNSLSQDLKGVFDLFDTEKKNVIDENDLTTVMFAYGFSPTKSEVKSIIGNESGRLDLNGFFNIFKENIYADLPEDAIEKSFKVFDKDGDGFISRDEVRDMVKLYIERPSDEYIDQILEEADLNNDGQIDFAEYKAMLEFN